MKKQYYIEQGKGFRVDIVLYHDGVETNRIKTWEDNTFPYLRDLEAEGYTRGCLKEDVDEAYDEYLFKLQNII